MNLVLGHLNSDFGVLLTKLMKKFSFEDYCILSRDSLLSYQVQKSLNGKLNKINLARDLKEIYYSDREAFYDFIENHELNSGNEYWWASWLSWKNPWISSFYLRYTQFQVTINC